MGYRTDFIGYIEIEPPLNTAEHQYLSAFSRSRRCTRTGGPYAVPGNPYAEDEAAYVDVNLPPEGQPGLWCDWMPTGEGAALHVEGREKFYQPVEWLTYLIEHFLKPGAHASRSNEPWFADFNFDHRLDGMVVACRNDTCEIFAIRVDRNNVTRSVLWPGVHPSFG